MNKNKNNTKAAGILLVLILMLMLGLIYINNINSVDGTGTKDVLSLALLNQLEAQNKDSALCSVDDMLAEASGTVVKLRNIEGEEIWNKSLTGKVTSMKSVGSILYILDNSNMLYCMSKDGKMLWNKQLEGEVRNIYTDKSGDILIEYNHNGGSKIQILSKAGIDEGSMALENAAIITFASGEGENTISVIDVSSDIVKTKIITLNLRGDMIWSDNLDNQIIPLLGYTKNNDLIAIGEKCIYKYKDESKIQNKVEINKTIYSACISEEGTVVVVKDKSGFIAAAYDGNLKKQGQLEIDKAPLGIISEKNNYILYYSERLLLANFKGQIRAEYKSLPEIKKAYFAEDGSIISVSDRLIQKLGFK